MTEFRPLSAWQLGLPALPFFLLIVLDLHLYPIAELKYEMRDMTWTKKSKAGEVVEVKRVNQEVPVVDIRWELLGIVVHREDMVTLNPKKVQDWLLPKVMEDRSKLKSVVFVLFVPVTWLVARGVAWHARHSHTATIKPGRALRLSCLVVCGLAIIAGMTKWTLSQLLNDARGLQEISEVFESSRTLSWMALTTFVIAPASEEFVFRLSLQRIFDQWLGPWKALILQAFCFGICHPTNPMHMFLAFLGGLGFGYIYLRCNRIWVAMVVHAFANAVFVLVVL